jgi:hypothetical protein
VDEGVVAWGGVGGKIVVNTVLIFLALEVLF